MSKTEDSYVKQMADALALVHLTQHPWVSVSPFDTDSRVDFVVVIKRNRSPKSSFGVIVRGTIDLIESEESASEKLKALEKKWRNGGVAMPLCVFLFSMKNNNGYYAWKLEPAIDEDRAILIPHATYHARRLNAEAVDEIIETVEKWSKAVIKSLVKK